MLRVQRRWWLPVGALVLTTSLVWAAVTSDQVGARIRNKINSKWRTSNLKVSVVPFSQAETQKGRFKTISVTASSVVISDVKLTGVYIRADDVTLDLSQLVRQNKVVSTRRKGGGFTARLSESDLNKALAHKKTPIQNLRAKLGGGTLTFTGTYKLGLGANLKLEGRLESPDHYRVNFVPTRASVSGVPVPAGPLKTLLQKMNPLLDLSKVPLSPRVNRLTISGGTLTMSS